MPGSVVPGSIRSSATNRPGGHLIRSLGFVALLLLILGGLNLGLSPIIDKFFIADLFDDKDITDIVYIIIGIAALISIPTLFRR